MFTVTYGGGQVVVEDIDDEARRRLNRELHPYFLISDDTPNLDAPILGRVYLRPELNAPQDAAWRPLLLHSGSHDYDLRRARVATTAGKRWIDSYDTGSLIVSDTGNRTVHVHNADLRKGAIDVRRVVRDGIFLPWLESQGAVTVHSAAVTNALGESALVVGDRGAGKTSVFMAGLVAGGSALSCERSIILPTPDGPVALACPENVSIFSGTLRHFPETKDLALGNVDKREWDRESKIRVAWQDLFSRFDVAPLTTASPITGVVFPRYSADSSMFERVSGQDSWFRLLDQTVTNRDVNRPNWLDWYQPNHTAETLDRLAQVPAVRGTWSDRASAYELTRRPFD